MFPNKAAGVMCMWHGSAMWQMTSKEGVHWQPQKSKEEGAHKEAGSLVKHLIPGLPTVAGHIFVGFLEHVFSF